MFSPAPGALVFDPTGNAGICFWSAESNQSALLYGAAQTRPGQHFTLRAEYRGSCTNGQTWTGRIALGRDSHTASPPPYVFRFEREIPSFATGLDFPLGTRGSECRVRDQVNSTTEGKDSGMTLEKERWFKSAPSQVVWI